MREKEGIYDQFSSVTQSCPTVCKPMDCSRPDSLSITNTRSLLKLMSIESVMPSSHLILCHPFFPPAFNLSQNQGLFKWVGFFASGGRSIGVSASASVLPMNIQDWFPVKLTSLISCSPRDSQESSQTPQFKSINSSMLSFLYGSTLISIHDYWKNHNFDQMGICR